MKKSKIKIPFLLALLFAFSQASSWAQCSEIEILNLRKTAIVFGQKNYKHVGVLKNPVHDAVDLTDSLEKIGFKVYQYLDADLATMTSAIEKWVEKINKYDVAFFYYSGHGAEVKGENFLFPTDAKIAAPSDLPLTAYSATRLLERMESKNQKFNIMILDACRNNPFTKSWSKDITTNGLAPMIGKGSFIGFAASPGTTASDGVDSSRNGIYTEAILKYITIPNLTIDQIFTKVNKYVRLKTNDIQIAFKNSSFSEDFCFSVKKSRKNSLLEKQFLIQPGSEIILTSNNELFLVDNDKKKLLKKDAESLQNITSFRSNKFIPSKIINGKTGYTYIADAVTNKLLIFDRINDSIKSTLSLKYQPTSMLVTQNERKSYIGNSGRFISVFDLVKGNVINEIDVAGCIKNIALSFDDKYVYALSQCDTGYGNLFIIDTKYDKIIKVKKLSYNSDNISVSLDNKYLYISGGGNRNYQTFILDVNSLEIIKTLELQANSFTFTPDNNYVFALGTNEIAVINKEDNSITNRISLTTIPKGLVFTNELGYVWLPQEERVLIFEIAKNLKNGVGFDPEFNYTSFIKDLKKEPGYENINTEMQILSPFKIEIYEVVGKIKRDLGNNYQFIQPDVHGPDDLKNSIIRLKCGVMSKMDSKKMLCPLFIIKLIDNKITLSILEDEFDNDPQIFYASVNDKRMGELGQFIRSYYLRRINRLK